MRTTAAMGLAVILGLTVYPGPGQARLDALRAAGMGRLVETRGDCLLSGEAALNLRQVRYSLYALDGDPVDLVDWASRAGWCEIDAPVPSFVGLERNWRIRFFGSGPRCLMLVSNPEEPGWLGAAYFESAGLFQETEGDAPGLDPGGWPRPAACKRVLYAAGSGFEAAWYKSSGSPAAAIARAKAALVATGWDTVRVGETALAARKDESGDIALFAGKDEEDTYLLVTATMEEK